MQRGNRCQRNCIFFTTLNGFSADPARIRPFNFDSAMAATAPDDERSTCQMTRRTEESQWQE